VNNLGMWGEFDVADSACLAYFGDLSEGGCRGGDRVYSAQLLNASGSWEAACAQTPHTFSGVTFATPSRCVPAATGMWGEFDLPDARCGGFSVQGTISYQDDSGVVHDMTGAEVELWSCGASFEGMCSWGKLATGNTDGSGAYSIAVPGPRAPDDQYVVRIVAANDAAYVYQQDTASVFFADLNAPTVATRGDFVLDFSRSFSNLDQDGWIGRHLHAAQVLRDARAFTLAYRDPREADALGRVVVGPKFVTEVPFMNSGIIHIHPDRLFEDRTLLHEYAHFVQENIGAYYPDGRSHSQEDITDPQYAFFEGFPEFFASAVLLMRVPPGAPPQELGAYTAKPCGGESVEGRVEDGLFLLMGDGDNSVCGSLTGRQRASCDRAVYRERAGIIMGIIDNELDYSMPGDKNLLTFRDAWRTRGGPAYLDSVYAKIGICM